MVRKWFYPTVYRRQWAFLLTLACALEVLIDMIVMIFTLGRYGFNAFSVDVQAWISRHKNAWLDPNDYQEEQS